MLECRLGDGGAGFEAERPIPTHCRVPRVDDSTNFWTSGMTRIDAPRANKAQRVLCVHRVHPQHALRQVSTAAPARSREILRNRPTQIFQELVEARSKNDRGTTTLKANVQLFSEGLEKRGSGPRAQCGPAAASSTYAADEAVWRAVWSPGHPVRPLEWRDGGPRIGSGAELAPPLRWA